VPIHRIRSLASDILDASPIHRLATSPFALFLQHVTGDEAPAGEPQRPRPPERPPARPPARPRATANMRLRELYHRRPESVGWSQRRCALAIRCSPSLIPRLRAYQDMEAARAYARASTAAARRRERSG
jgi:hypothetical protein